MLFLFFLFLLLLMVAHYSLLAIVGILQFGFSKLAFDGIRKHIVSTRLLLLLLLILQVKGSPQGQGECPPRRSVWQAIRASLSLSSLRGFVARLVVPAHPHEHTLRGGRCSPSQTNTPYMHAEQHKIQKKNHSSRFAED